MAFQFDSRTGFLITKAMQRLMSSDSQSKASDVNVNINVEDNRTDSTPAKAPAKTKSPKNNTARPKKQSNSPRTARQNQHNQYSVSDRAISSGGKLFGGELFSMISELKMAVSIPTRMAKNAIGKYREKRESKQDKKSEELLGKESEEQTDRLEDILKEMKKGGGSSKFSLGKGLGAGAIGSALLGGGIKGLLKRLGIAGLIYSVVDGYSDNIKGYKDGIGKGISEDLTLSEKLQFASNQIGKSFAHMVNTIAGHTVISDEEVEGFTANSKQSVSLALDNLKENYPKVGGAIADSLTALDEVMGSATSYLTDASRVLMDSFRKKSDMEKEFVKAQDAVRNRDTFGETLSGTDNREYEQAKAKMRELAPQLLKDKDFAENSAYAQTAKDSIDPELARKAKKQKQQEHLSKIVEEVGKRELKVKELEQLKQGLADGEFMAKAKLMAFYTSEKQFEEELKAKKFQLEQHKKLAETAKKIVEETEEALKILDIGNTVTDSAVKKSVDLSGKLWKTSTMEYEGFRGEVYKDTKGFDTIGYGHKLTADDKKSGRYKNGINQEDGKALYKKDRAKHDAKLYKRYEWVKDQPKEVREALEDMAFNMGVGNGKSGLSSFKKTLGLIKAGKYKKASVSMMDSKYAKDVGKRANDNAIRIASASVAKVVKVDMDTSKKKKAVEEVVETAVKATTKEVKTASGEASVIAPLVKAVLDSNDKVIKSINEGNKVAEKTLASNEPNIIVNIENKSTNKNIGGMV